MRQCWGLLCALTSLLIFPSCQYPQNEIKHVPLDFSQGTAHQVDGNPGSNASGSKILSRFPNPAPGESEAVTYLEQLDNLYSDKCYKYVLADWNYQSDLTTENERIKNEFYLDFTRASKEAAKNVSQFPWRRFQDADLRRQYRFYDNLGYAALPEDKFKELTATIDAMQAIYNKAKICSYKDPLSCGLNLEPELKDIMRTSSDYKELEHVWTQWREQSGKKMRKLYEKYVELGNEAARLNNYPDLGAYWLRSYESNTFKKDVEELWQTLKPFYLELHTYVRSQLRKKYGADKVPKDEPIPAHLLGDMWAQSWNNIYDATVPFPGKPSIDVTPAMNKQGYTPLKMFKVSEEFFTSLGLLPMPPEFWKESIIERIPGREMGCHASAWDFCNGKDFRIKQCTTITMEDLITVHHEMGHTQYQLQYKDLPMAYREGANPGFHEAVGDTLALSVSTPKHLREIGLLDKNASIEDRETSLNFLYYMALEKIAFLPFAYLMDKWRWDVFNGTVKASDYNCHWWKLREEYQGLKPPVTRSEEDFDPGSKYHIPADVEYLRYFVSFVIQFQFHRSLCITAGQYDPNDPAKPLHNCDIYRSREAGAKLASMLSMGSSKPWPEAMRVITGQEKMDASAIREYFKPLEEWLRQKNKENKEKVGWKSSMLTSEKSCQKNPVLPALSLSKSAAYTNAAAPFLHYFSINFLIFFVIWAYTRA